jgi:hypothetical protein
MSELNQRQYHAFLSHAHADKAIVDQLDQWLTNVAGLEVWYDSRDLPAGTQIGSYLAEAMFQCRAAILVLSKAAVESGWVREEYECANAQRAKYRGAYHIIPILIEDCKPPGFLTSTLWINLQGGQLSLDVAADLLKGFYYHNPRSYFNKADIYVIRTWKAKDAALANQVCQFLSKRHRLVGDAQDRTRSSLRKDFSKESGKERVKALIASCSASIAILSDRGQGKTSPYFLEEIRLAQSLGVPCLVVAESTVILPKELKIDHLIQVEPSSNGDRDLAEIEEWLEFADLPVRQPYVFFGTSLSDQHRERNQKIIDMIERVSNMECVTGDDIHDGSIREGIVERIRRCHVMIADISDGNLNTCIETGIAWGANRKFHLIANGTRDQPKPFMFRDFQLSCYTDDFELLGIIHRLLYPYRQHVWNYEL